MSWCKPDCFVGDQCVREREAGTQGRRPEGGRGRGERERERVGETEWESESGRGRGRRGDGEGTERGGARGDRERERDKRKKAFATASSPLPVPCLLPAKSNWDTARAAAPNAAPSFLRRNAPPVEASPWDGALMQQEGIWFYSKYVYHCSYYHCCSDYY